MAVRLQLVVMESEETEFVIKDVARPMAIVEQPQLIAPQVDQILFEEINRSV